MMNEGFIMGMRAKAKFMAVARAGGIVSKKYKTDGAADTYPSLAAGFAA